MASDLASRRHSFDNAMAIAEELFPQVVFMTKSYAVEEHTRWS